MKKQLRALGDFWREEYGRWVGMTAIAFLVLVVLSYIAGRLFPEISATILTYFNEVVADSGIVRDDGSFSALALFGNNLRAMVLSTLYGFIPFLYLPALSMGVNAILLGMVASSVNGQWLLLAAGILPTASLSCRRCASVWRPGCVCARISTAISAKTRRAS